MFYPSSFHYRRVIKIEVKNMMVVKGVQFDGVKKILPISEVSQFVDQHFHEIFLVDNTRTLFGLPPNFAALESLARSTSLPILFGGGISTLDHVMAAFELGASRIYINSALASHPSLLEKVSNICGRQAICGGIEYRNDFTYSFQCFSEAGREPLDISVYQRICDLQHLVSEFIITSITLDGTCQGIDYDLINHLHQLQIESVLTICGGITVDSLHSFSSLASSIPQLTGVAMSSYPFRSLE